MWGSTSWSDPIGTLQTFVGWVEVIRLYKEVGEKGLETVGCGVTWECSYNHLFSFGLHSWSEEINVCLVGNDSNQAVAPTIPPSGEVFVDNIPGLLGRELSLSSDGTN